MSESGQMAMNYLFLFMVVFLLLVGGTLWASFLRRNKKVPPVSSPTLESPGKESPDFSGKGDLKTLTEESVSKGQVVETKVPPSGEGETVTLEKALQNTRRTIFGRIQDLFTSRNDKHTALSHFEELEEILYTCDLGPQTVQRLLSQLQEDLSKKEQTDYQTIKDTLKQEILDIFSSLPEQTLPMEQVLFKGVKRAEVGPTVLMIVGVNGAGKTTSIGKIAASLAGRGLKVLVAAGDTFRAAAGGQLKVWTERAQVEIFSPAGVSDPSAVAFDAVAKAKAQNYDVVILDTAGRLHTQSYLMEELKKTKRVMAKVIEEAPHEILIVLDANSGQNALIQAREFHQALGLSGAILTKMDGTAKGGVALGLAHELKLPIKLIGIGEKIEDLRPFSYTEFVDSLVN